MKEKIKALWNKVLEVVFKRFWLVFFVGLIVGLADFIGVTTIKGHDTSLGFILPFVYFFLWLIYKMVKG
jgi:uncharacterized membrane protein